MENNEPTDYNVKRLIPPSSEIKGKLLLYDDKVVFEPDEEHGGKIVIPIAKIKDVKLATEKDIDALAVQILGLALSLLYKSMLSRHKILLIDVEDEYGIIQHLTFEGENDLKYAVEEFYDIRKTRKLEGESKSSDKLQMEEPKLYWKCPRCLRQNALKVKFCTRCGFENPEKFHVRKE